VYVWECDSVRHCVGRDMLTCLLHCAEWIELVSLQRETCQSALSPWPIPSLTKPLALLHTKPANNKEALILWPLLLTSRHVFLSSELDSQWSLTIFQSDINHLSKAQALPEIKVLVYYAMFFLRCLHPWPCTDLRSTHKLHSEGHSWIKVFTCDGLETPVDHRAVASSWRFMNAFLKVPSLQSPQVYCISDSGHFFS